MCSKYIATKEKTKSKNMKNVSSSGYCEAKEPLELPQDYISPNKRLIPSNIKNVPLDYTYNCYPCDSRCNSETERHLELPPEYVSSKEELQPSNFLSSW